MVGGMRALITTLLLTSLAASALAVDKADLDNRIRKLAFKLQSMQAKSDKAIPARQLREAQGIILLDRTKAGFLFAFQGGSGLVMSRTSRGGPWGAPAFLTASEASLGFQIGGQQSFVVILLMNTNALSQMVIDGAYKFGGEASGTAGTSSDGVEGTVSNVEPAVQVYTDREGLYGGAAVKGDAISPDADANAAYYGQYLTMKDILIDHKAKPTPVSTELADKIDQLAK